MSKIMLGLLGTLVATVAFAQQTPEYEAVCRLKAKEIAAESYRGCVTEGRTTQIDQLKKEYQEKLRSMKEDYDRDLKRLSSGKANQTTSQVAPTTAPAVVKTVKGKKVAKVKTGKSLPAKTAAAAPTTTVEEMTVDLKPSTSQMSDDSVLDIPEPTAIEDVPTAGL